MLKSRAIFSSICLLVLTPFPISAMSPEQKEAVHKHFEQIGLECIKDNPITADDVAALRASQQPSGDGAPCFLACVSRKIGILDDAGMMQKENVLQMAEKVFGDAEELQNIADYLHACAHVNSAPVTDGSKGCERAMLGYKCLAENASKFGFDF